MTIVHGVKISSHQIENIVSREFSDKEFASLCNAVVWASSRRECPSLPSFTERVNVKDGGIDAEWTLKMPQGDNFQSPLIGAGWNVFQYKRRDISAGNRAKIFDSLAQSLVGEVKKLVERTGYHPNRYVLFINLDLTHETKIQNASNPQIGQLKEALLTDYDETEQISVEIVGAGELSAILNDLPHIRSAYFVSSQFSSWQKYSLDHDRKKLFGKRVRLIGKDRQLAELKSFLEIPETRAIVLSGSHNIGKTRLVLETTANRPINTVVALDSRSFTITDMLQLKTPGIEVVLIVEDPEPTLAEKLVEQALAEDWLKLLLTFPTVENAPKPNFGLDKRVKNISVLPLTQQQSEELLKASESQLDYGLQTWIVEQAGGNPGILLIAAKLGLDLRKESYSFLESVASSFERKIRRMFDEDAIQEISLLSLLTHVGIKGQAKRELVAICSLFGDGVQPKNIIKHKPQFVDAGILQERGSYVEILPPLFANTLAAKLVGERTDELIALFAYLDRPAQIRLFNRLHSVPNEIISPFWNILFGTNSLLSDLSSVIVKRLGYLLRSIAIAMPEKTAQFVIDNLEKLPIADRLELKGEARQDIIGVLDDLLFRNQTSLTALYGFALLADAKMENYSDHATNIFCECFVPLHPQLPLSLDDRRRLLERLLNREQPGELRLLAVKAIEQSISRRNTITLRRSSGAKPLDSRLSLTYGQIWDYIEDLVQLLFSIVDSETSNVSDYIWTILPYTIAQSTIQARPHTGVSRFKTLVTSLLEKRSLISVPKLVASLDLTIATLNSRLEKQTEENNKALQEHIKSLQSLVDRLYKGEFSIRLQIWTADHMPLGRKYEIDKDGRRIYRGEQEIQKLVKEIINDPSLLTLELIEWLCSNKASNAGKFFHWLGKLDCEKYWIEEIDQIAEMKGGEVVFPSYYGGLSNIYPEYVSNRLDMLVDKSHINPEIIILAIRYLEGSLAGVARIEKPINNGKINPVFVERIISTGGWISTLKNDEFLRLLKSIAGNDLEHTMSIIDLLGMWLHYENEIKDEMAEIAWKSLEVVKPQQNGDAYHCNRLAAYLTVGNPERGFQLFQKLLKNNDSWNPIEQDEQNDFWESLVKSDRDRAYRAILQISLTRSWSYIYWPSDYHELVNSSIDGSFLIRYAYENEEQAKLIAACINTKRPDYWTIALNIIKKYPQNPEIREGLTRGITRMEWEFIAGPFDKHYEKCKEAVTRMLHEPTTPSEALPWLQQLDRDFSAQMIKEQVWEEDRELNWLSYSQNQAVTPEQEWGIEMLRGLGRQDLVELLESLANAH